MPRKLTASNLLEPTSLMPNSFQGSRQTDVIHADFSKALDRVHQPTLNAKLKRLVSLLERITCLGPYAASFMNRI